MQPEQKPTISRSLLKHLHPIETGQPKPSRTFSVGSDISTPVTATSNSNAAAQMWKNRTSIIAKGTTNYVELMECKDELERDKLFLSLAPPDLVPALTERSESHSQTISRKQQEVDAKLDELDTQLNATDLWSFPIFAKRTDEYMEPLLKRIESLKDQFGKVEQSAKLAEERRRERAEKSERLKRELSHAPSHKDIMERGTNLEARQQQLDPRIDDEEDELERNMSYQTNLVDESTKSYPNLRDLEPTIKSLTDGLVDLRKVTLSFTDLSPALKIQLDDHSNVQSRLTSLTDEKQAIVDKQIRQFSQDFDQYCLEFGNADSVAGALNAFKAEIDSAVDKCIDEQSRLLKEFIQESNNVYRERLDNQLGPVGKKISSLFGNLTVSDSNIA